MRLTELSHEGFRNLVPSTVALSTGTTVLLGANGQGKTNFLEAVGVLATGKSFRRARAQEMLAQEARSFVLRGRVERDGRASELVLAHADGRRITSVNRQPAELTEYISHLTVVPITLPHAGIVRGGPQDRRDFLDRGILGVQPSYLRSLASYRRTLRHVNALLRDPSETSAHRELVAAWLDRLADEAAELVLRRRAYVEDLRQAISSVGPLFAPVEESLALELNDVLARAETVGSGAAEATPPTREQVVALLRERLEETLPRARHHGQAVVGPHRDDLVLSLGGRDARRFASSGQQRNALLVLKVAKVEVFRRHRAEGPVLLVDDADTEIDADRLRRFLDHVGGRTQAVLTSSKGDLFERRPDDALFYRVEEGVLTPL